MAGVKLIDGHAMLLRVKALQRKGAVDLSYYNAVKEAVQMEPGANAIPVEWLESKRKEALHEGMRPDEVEAVEMVLWMWQKEQEAK